MRTGPSGPVRSRRTRGPFSGRPRTGSRRGSLIGGVVEAEAALDAGLNFPIPVDEENNPNFETCFDRDA